MKCNLKEIISQTDFYNFHSHTQFCDGRDVMEKFVESAIANGFQHYGFSPHSPIPIASTCNMAMADVPLYLAEVERLRTLYGNRINLYASMEIDYLSEEWGPSNEYFQSLPLDYRIGSIHFIRNQEGEWLDIDGRYERFKGYMIDKFHGDVEYVVREFYRSTLAMLQEGKINIIGHFDKIAGNASLFAPSLESEAWYKTLIEEVMHAIVESGVIVEVNTKSVVRNGRTFPHQRYFTELMQSGVTIAVNSDAHEPHLITASRKEILQQLRNS